MIARFLLRLLGLIDPAPVPRRIGPPTWEEQLDRVLSRL